MSIRDNAVSSFSFVVYRLLEYFIEISAVKINGHTADFVHYDPLAHLTIGKTDEYKSYPELKRKIYSALSESDEGELSIAVPSQVSVVAPTSQSEPSTSTSAPAVQSAPEYLPLIVRIEYLSLIHI